MQYNIRLIDQTDRHLLLGLLDEKSILLSLHNKEDIVRSWFVDSNVVGSHHRISTGVFDNDNNLVFAMGGKQLGFVPAWELSWVVGKKYNKLARKISAQYCFCKMLSHLGEQEFYVAVESKRGKNLEKIVKSVLINDYHCFTDGKISKYEKPNYTLHWMLIGNRLQSIDVDIKKFIKKD